MVSRLDSVRQGLFANGVADPQAAAALGCGGDRREPLELDVVQDRSGHADLSDPIVGFDVSFTDGKGPGALAIKPLPPPHEPKTSEMDRRATNPPMCTMVPFQLCTSTTEQSPPPLP